MSEIRLHALLCDRCMIRSRSVPLSVSTQALAYAEGWAEDAGTHYCAGCQRLARESETDPDAVLALALEEAGHAAG